MNIKIIDKLKGILSITPSQVLSLCTHCKQQVLKAHLMAVTGLKRGITRLKVNISVNERMARHGGLFVSFSLLLLAVRQTKEVSSWWFIPPMPVYFSTVLRIILIGISLIVVFVISWIWQKHKLVNVLKGRLKPLAYLIIVIVLLLLLFVFWLILSMPTLPVYFFTVLGIIALLISLAFMVAVFCKGLAKKLERLVEDQLKSTYWMVFWIVYSVGWIKGWSNVPADTYAFHLAWWVGFVLFLIIGFIYLRATRQAGKQPYAI
jgi:hypothetical protein